LQDAGLSTSQLAGTFSQRVILLLGKEDNKTNDKYLRKTQKAMEQGEHRLARGQKFYESIQTFCAQAKVKNHWKILEVSGVSHSPQKMSNKAARLIDQFCKNVVKKKKTK
jgi:uncharacterized protein YueI